MVRFFLLSFVLFITSATAATDVRVFGAQGNGSADDTNAIQNAINACPADGTVNFSPGNYLVRGLHLKSSCTYAGFSGSVITLSAQNGFVFDASEQSNIHITGLAFDGNGKGGAFIAQGYAPIRNLQIENCDFRNVVSSAWFPANLTIVSTWGVIDGVIQNNRFTNISGGIWLTTVQNVSILNNSFTDVTQGDAIYIAPNPVSFQSGDNLRIAGNTGSHINNIAIEIFRPDPTNGSVLTAPIIENNSFSDWTGGPNGMGLSITHGDGAIVRGNRISNSNGPQQLIGIELIVTNAQVYGNVISSGFYFGIAVQGKPSATITDNTITNSGDTGILLACSQNFGRCSSRNSVISNNTIHNPRLNGIKLDNDWTNTQVTRNTIVRTGGQFPDDNKVFFSGISQSPAPGPGFIDSNTIIQDATTPTPGFWFCGIRINSQMPGSTVRDNSVRSQSSYPFGSGLIDNTNNATVGWVITGNSYVNVYHAIN
jgi:parallel beta-helix repeat protein